MPKPPELPSNSDTIQAPKNIIQFPERRRVKPPKDRAPLAGYFEHWAEYQNHELKSWLYALMSVLTALGSSPYAYPFFYLFLRENRLRNQQLQLVKHYRQQLGQPPETPEPPDILA